MFIDKPEGENFMRGAIARFSLAAALAVTAMAATPFTTTVGGEAQSKIIVLYYHADW